MIERIHRKENNKSRYPVLTDLGKDTLAQAYKIAAKNHTEFFKEDKIQNLNETLMGILRQ